MSTTFSAQPLALLQVALALNVEVDFMYVLSFAGASVLNDDDVWCNSLVVRCGLAACMTKPL